MDNRDQPSFNPSYYPHHVEYGQPEPHPGNGPQGYQQNQQPVYLPLASFSTPYPYPMAHEQQAVYGMSPDFLMPQGSTLVCAPLDTSQLLQCLMLVFRDTRRLKLARNSTCRLRACRSGLVRRKMLSMGVAMVQSTLLVPSRRHLLDTHLGPFSQMPDLLPLRRMHWVRDIIRIKTSKSLSQKKLEIGPLIPFGFVVFDPCKPLTHTRTPR